MVDIITHGELTVPCREKTPKHMTEFGVHTRALDRYNEPSKHNDSKAA